MKSIIKMIMVTLLLVPALHARSIGGGHPGGGGGHPGGGGGRGMGGGGRGGMMSRGGGYGHGGGYGRGGYGGYGRGGWAGGYGGYGLGGVGLGFGLPLVSGGGTYVVGDGYDDYPYDDGYYVRY